MDSHRSGLALDLLPGAGQVDKAALPWCFKAEYIGGICSISPTKIAQYAVLDLRPIDADFGFADDFAFGVCGRRGLSQAANWR